MRSKSLSRRQFLHNAGRLAAGAGTVRALEAASAFTRDAGVAAEPESPTTAPASAPAASTVIQVRSDEVTRDRSIRADMVSEMLSRMLCRLTGRPRIEDAWRAILRPDDVIGVKFNHTASRELGITPLFARLLVRSLVNAGWKRQNIVLIEIPDSLREQLGTAAPAVGWSARETDFGSGKDRFAAVLDQITALVNVPFLKTHNIAGMTGCLKNLSHALVRSPARYHANRCSPFIGDIVAAEPIRSKLRLHLVNALYAVFDKGPTASADTIWPAGTLIASFDPVAADAVGLEMLNLQRTTHGLPPLDDADRPIPYLYEAQRRGLGTMSWDRIRHVKIRL